MELNHLLLFIAVASSLLVIGKAFRAPAALPWRGAVVVLLISAIAWFSFRKEAGFISTAAWLALLWLPSMIRNRGMSRRRWSLRVTPVVGALIFLNVAAFIAEVAVGGSGMFVVEFGNDSARVNAALHQLGEVDPILVLHFHQYWRLLTGVFLHYGLLHMTMNLLGLVILGSPFEAEIGPMRFTICYLLSGIASTLGVVLLVKWRFLTPVTLVGASGAVMGIVGAWGGFLLRHRHLPLARLRLKNIALIVAMQVAFDLVTPRISMSAHLCGLGAGLVLGLLIARPHGRAARFALSKAHTPR